MPDQRIPQAVPRLQEFSPEWKVTLASARLKPIYQPFRYKEYPHSRSRSVLSHTGRHKKFQETNSIRLFNRARTKPCFFQSRLTRIYARPRIPQAVLWLQEFSRKRKLSLAGAWLKPTYPVQRKKKRVPALQLSDRPVASGHNRVGGKH